jgi:hypothetical protein
MSGRFVFPHAFDPHMTRDDALTLARTTSQQNAVLKVTAAQSGTQKVEGNNSSQPAMPNPANESQMAGHAATSPQRRHFVFADPVAFTHVPSKLPKSVSNLP